MEYNPSPDGRLLAGELSAAAKIDDVTTSCYSQWAVLLRRKELLLKGKQWKSTLCEIVLPALLCMLVLIGANASTIDTFPNTEYAPANMTAALSAIGPAGFLTFLSQQAGSAIVPSGMPGMPTSTFTPTAIPPLSLFLGYSYISQQLANVQGFPVDFPPFDGTYLAVTPNTSAVRDLVDDVLNKPVEPWMLNPRGVIGGQIAQLLALLSFTQPQLNLSVFPEPATLRAYYEVRYFKDEGAIEAAARSQEPIWAALAFAEPLPKNGTGVLSYNLRFNASAVPRQQSPYDRFPNGLSELYWPYYSTGFLSLQSALNQHTLSQHTTNQTAPLAVGVPFPVPAYVHNTFFNFAGNLIGLVVVFSFLIPISTMLRALVLEKESKLREQLLTMGATLPAYYGSVLTTYGASYFITALVCAAIIFPSCYTYSDPTLVVALFVLFALATLAFTLALSPFFKNARLAALAGPLLFFISSQFYNAFLDKGVLSQGQDGAKWAVSIFPSMAFYLGASLMAQYEGSQQGLSWAEVFHGDGFGVGQSILMLIFDVGFWLLVAWYLDQVLPSEYGLQKPFYFLCMPSYWCGAVVGTDADGDLSLDGMSLAPLSAASASPAETSEAPLAVEPLATPVTTRGVAVKRLYKTWGKRVAVHPMDLEMAPGQVTGLLGANGAGKTTTISMLTGLIPPTSGTATIDGLSIRTQMRAIRLSLGVCTQLNTIFGPLTPVQHLELYGRLKGLSGTRLATAIEQLLTYVMLQEKRLTAACNLSGGQKRKLCLAISLIGNARTVFLDEPTSGMDPHSRRSIWALLREQREGRTIVLTTHFLDEAEILSDRIAIMAEGRLRCLGSPLFLKDYFGTGYSLSLTKQPSAAPSAAPGAVPGAVPGAFDAAALLEWARTFVPTAALINETSLEATVRLPGDDLLAFQRLFTDLEQKLGSFGVKDFGATCTTLEDVFLKINENALQRLEDKQAVRKQQQQLLREGGASTHGAGSAAPGASDEGALRHTDGVELVPDMEAAQTAVAYDKSSVTPVGTEGGMRQSLGTALTLPRQPPSSSYDARGAARADGFSKVRLFGGLVTKRGLSARRDFCTTSCMIFFPVVLVWLALALLNVTGSFIATPKPMPLTPEATFPKLVGVSGGQEIKRPVPLVLPEGNVAASSWAPALKSLGWNVNQPGQVPCSGDNVFPNVTIGLSAYLLANPSAVLPAALAFSPDTPIAGTTEVVGVASLLFNSTATLSPPALVNTLYDTLVQLATGGAVSIAGSMQSLPVSDQTKATFDSFISLFASIMILIPFAFVAAQFVVPLVRERESGSKQMQFISGVGPVIYWLSNWAWDALMFLIIAASTLVVFVIQNRSEFTGTTEAFGGTTLLLLTFGVAVVPLSSAASFGFTTPSNGLIVMIAFHFLSGFGLNVCDFILQSISTETQKINDGLRYLYRLFPAYCLGQGFFSMSTRQLVANFAAFGQPQPKLYDWDQLGAPITYLFLEGLGFMAITLVLQYAESDIKLQQRLFGPFERLQQRLFGRRAPEAGPNGAANGGDHGGTDGLPVAQGRRGRAERSSIEDMSVLEERQVIDEGGAETSDSAALIIKHLRREFGPKVAVRDLCLRIGRGECFGFLGVNGAGKSTTFSMLTGSLVPTSGDALLEGMSILHEQNKIRRLVGYCPQHDALEALMTAREALRMYAKIKDVAPGSIEAEVEDLIQDLDLSKFADKPCGTYSGGNKRKLCVGIALVGSPQVTTSDGL